MKPRLIIGILIALISLLRLKSRLGLIVVAPILLRMLMHILVYIWLSILNPILSVWVPGL